MLFINFDQRDCIIVVFYIIVFYTYSLARRNDTLIVQGILFNNYVDRFFIFVDNCLTPFRWQCVNYSVGQGIFTFIFLVIIIVIACFYDSPYFWLQLHYLSKIGEYNWFTSYFVLNLMYYSDILVSVLSLMIMCITFNLCLFEYILICSF